MIHKYFVNTLLILLVIALIAMASIYNSKMKVVTNYYDSTERMMQLIQDDYYCTHVADSITLNDYINPTFDVKFKDCKLYHEYISNRTYLQDILNK